MNINEIVHELKLRIDDRNISRDEQMKSHSSFKIGGPVELMITPSSVDEIKHAYKVLKRHQVPVTLIGNGSNILVTDLGIRGAVIKIAEKFSGVEVEGSTIKAQAGALLSSTSNLATSHGLGGFEFASGIPGTIGGAVFMNAGAYGGEMKDVVVSVTALDQDCNVIRFEKENLKFGYRASNVQDLGYTVLEVELQLHEDAIDEIQSRVNELTVKRTTKQPLQLPSAGSTFKRPEGFYAGKLIEDAGLRGVRYGDAQVSDLHCGFVVNVGEATYREVITLIKVIQKAVKDQFDVELCPEVRVIGEGA
ncbi:MULTISPECIES: UDP-N-acetylmuramate dehydrogenase [unclassified Fusibacter]|uniref:UDP-N-acetylmuramate dehydrogenase n=1 Tax=unclassified Fusibacter TaxID=2624464 RepID=UPI001012A5ED|nr:MULTISPECIES: UDP-N-acetylmuramate dehydrogenase [unclassified Fusibacter]MCK8061035.1 UDP-N-acetylmuramate dehydrogenase [Fusibacter sp. A2]RXV63711.1 UDP-N-acetylmuramate dehydrogenase [Fusibacter sp. A1]